MDNEVKKFNAGIYNQEPASEIPTNAAQDSMNWITGNGKITLSHGRKLIGTEGGIGRNDGEHYTYKTSGERVRYRKIGTKIQYWNGSSYVDVITGLTADSDYSFANYSSLAGNFLIISGVDGLYKINTANPTDYLSLYVKGTNDKGKILIDKSRMLMWDCSDVTKTSLRVSWIDGQDSSTYTTITGELLEGSGTTYVGTLDFKSLVAIANCFALEITANTAGGTETFKDNRDGTLTGSLGGTGTINYITGAYSITFNSAVTLLVDQQQTTQDTAVAFGEADATTKYFIIAQKFRPSKTALGGVRLYKKANTGTPVGAITIDVVADNAGSPSSTVLASVTIPIATYNALPIGEFEALFTSAITVGITTDYWLRAYTSADTSNHPNLGANSAGGYASGSVKYYNVTDGWTAIATIDLYFKTIYGNASVTYQYENSNSKGITDFTFSLPRVEGTGNIISQDIGGDKIVNVLIGQDGAYYSLKEKSAYKLDIAPDDASFDNNVYRREIGTPFFRASISSSKGIVFVNTANEEKPILTILQRNELGNEVEPTDLLTHFDFSLFDYSDACMEVFDNYILIACRLNGSTSNDRILLCDIVDGTVDVLKFRARTFAKEGGDIYAGHPLTMNTYKIFDGFDDDGVIIDNYWIGKEEDYSSNRLKKFRKLMLQGLIDPDQALEIYIDYDNSGFELVGTVVGSGAYVDYASSQSIGSNMLGSSQLGGDDFVEAYPYLCEIKMKCPKFRNRVIKYIAKGIGYIDIKTSTDVDILSFENRIPKKYRQKQNVSLDGLSTDN